MANTTPTPVSFVKALHLVALLIAHPEKFEKIQAEDAKALNAAGELPRLSGIHVVRNALASSFMLVIGSAAIGYAAGMTLGMALSCFSTNSVAWFQIVGTSLLLWGTLFVRGWDIQTYGGVSLTERVNQWIYRTLYCLGTATLVASIALPTCRA